MAVEEVRKHDFPSVNPWDVLIWKLDSIERQVTRLEERMSTLDQRMGSLEGRTFHSYLVLQWTAILGFAAVIASIFLAPLLK